MTCDPTYLVNFVVLYTVLASFQSHEGRVLNSLNGIKGMKSRLTSKAKINVVRSEENDIHKLVLGLTAVIFSSKHDVSCFAPDINVPSQFMRNLIDDNSSSELLEGTQIQDLYDLLEIKLVNFQINLFVSFYPSYYFPILEKLNASSALALCIVQDESLLKAMEVYVVVEPFLGHVSPSIIGSGLCSGGTIFNEKWSSNGPLLEILMGSLLFHGIITANVMEGLVESEPQLNYNNIHKVLWESFLEPWKFQVSLRRQQGKSALQNSPVMTDVHLESTMNLNINVTESLIEFDIPFGVSLKILDRVYPGHEFPLPLHLAESGRIRWHPLGNTYLWSEVYSISNILSNESKIGHLRVLCYLASLFPKNINLFWQDEVPRPPEFWHLPSLLPMVLFNALAVFALRGINLSK
ncbi:hypothetical protein Lser_V15G31428 [Lactuca serriola]